MTLPAITVSAKSRPEKPPPPKVQACVDANLPRWRTAIAGKRPRLFFDEKGWTSFAARFCASVDTHRHHFEAAIARAHQIASAPTPLYPTPTEISQQPDLSPLEAEQELWQRVVGNDLVVPAVVLALDDADAVRAKLHVTVLAACGYPQVGPPLQCAEVRSRRSSYRARDRDGVRLARIDLERTRALNRPSSSLFATRRNGP